MASKVKIMRSIRCHAFGKEDVMKVENIPKPNLSSPDEILIKVEYCGVNPVDTFIRQGKFGTLPPLPYTPGKDCAGTIEKCGEKVTKFKAGERVFTSFEGVTGGCAEFCVFKEENVFPLHPSLTVSQGAALGIPYFTALRALTMRCPCDPDHVVLVHGASGAVGVASVQLAKCLGNRVLGTAGTPQGIEVVRKCGADDVFNHRQGGYMDKIMKWTQGRGVDVILEMRADINLNNDLSLLARHGHVVVIGGRGKIAIDPGMIMGRESIITAVSVLSSTQEEKRELSEDLCKYVSEGRVLPVVSQEFPLDQTPQAHHHLMHKGGATGKIVVQVG